MSYKGRSPTYYLRKPWAKYINYILWRCSDKTRKYYKKGIKCYLTVKDLENLWFRDEAYLMLKPSIDRINVDKGYTFDNCRFIELKENQKRNWIKKRGLI